MQGPVVLSFESSPSIADVDHRIPARRRGPVGRSMPVDGDASIPLPILAEGSERTVAAPPLVPEVRRAWLSARAMARLLAALLVLNLVDAVMTLWAVRLGVATEANSIMAAALSVGEPVFLASKLAVVGAGAAVLWVARRRRIAQVGACVCLSVYLCLALVHVWTGALIAEAMRALSGLA